MMLNGCITYNKIILECECEQCDVPLSPGVRQWSSLSGASHVGRSWVTSGRHTSVYSRPSILRGEMNILNVCHSGSSGSWQCNNAKSKPKQCILSWVKLCQKNLLGNSQVEVHHSETHSLVSCHKPCSFHPQFRHE